MKTLKKMIPLSLKHKITLYKSYIKRILSNKQKEMLIQKQYYKRFGRRIDFNNPVSYTEKINVSKLYNYSDIKAKLTDKCEVREWVTDKIGKEYLIPLVGVYNKFEDIDFDKLPNKFVIKCNHDSGSSVVCSDKSKLDYKKLRKDYHYYLKRNLAYITFEMHYKNIIPKIIIEENMGDSINDYKFLCFNGKVYYCWVDFDRFSNHRRNIYDLDWKLQPFKQYSYDNNLEKVPKPKNFEKMVEIAEKLCAGFDHVRVDLYDIDGKIYFGEMTFTNGNGMEAITPYEYDVMLGNLWDFKRDR